jgi:glutaredoxin-like YruB-family protein
MATFNAAAAAYQALNTAQKQRQQDLATLHQNLDDLLVERTKQQTATARAKPADQVTAAKQPAPPQVSKVAKKVVMYTTSSCPACRAAKQYFARKGVSYEERDVNNNSSAREEFQRLGGSGVPLILVGDEKIRGFSEQRLNQLL